MAERLLKKAWAAQRVGEDAFGVPQWAWQRALVIVGEETANHFKVKFIRDGSIVWQPKADVRFTKPRRKRIVE